MPSPKQPQMLPLPLPPLEEVKRIAQILDPAEPKLILDAGSGSAHNAYFLAQHGHTVVALEREFNEASAAKRTMPPVQERGRCLFVVGDTLRPMFRTLFDVVLCNEVLHMSSKSAGNRLLNNLRSQTRQGGLNLVSGYVLRAGTGNVRNVARCLQPDELRENYQQAGWRILNYTETYLPLQQISGREIVSSRAVIIAEREWF